MLRLKSCLRCKGDVVLDRDYLGCVSEAKGKAGVLLQASGLQVTLNPDGYLSKRDIFAS